MIAILRSTPNEGGRILVLDDDSASRNVIVNALREDGHAVDTVDVVPAWSHNPALLLGYDVLIITARLPAQLGVQICRQIREAFSLFELPILFISDLEPGIAAATAHSAGANETLPLPVQPADLRARVGHLLVLKASAADFIRTEVNFRQPKVNPHFLYNTLSAIAALSEEDRLAMRSLLENLGEYLRELFRYSGTMAPTSLGQELQLVDAYLAIEKIRFGSRLQVNKAIDHDITDVPIPPLTIQSLVENAVVHGLLPRQRGGRLDLCVWAEDDYCTISIRDDGVGMNIDTCCLPLHRANVRFGSLSYIERKLRQSYGTGLCIRSSPLSGTTVSFKIPMTGGQIA